MSDITITAKPDIVVIPSTASTTVIQTGLQGPPGMLGSPGQSGSPGLQGVPGLNGLPGINGATWFTGPAAPSDASGNNGDLYLRTATGDIYQKESGIWGSPIETLTGTVGATGPAGATWFAAAGAPSISSGNNGDFYLSTSSGDVYHKASGAWGSPIENLMGPPGTPGTNGVFTGLETIQTTMVDTDWLFFKRSADNTYNRITRANALAGVISGLLDGIGAARGDILFRGAAGWSVLAPGTAGLVLQTGGAGADPSWVASGAGFPSGTVLAGFVQSAAPVGWTKVTTWNDVGLRVVSGNVSTTLNRTPFSTTFGQTATGGFTLTSNEVPAHSHSYNAPNGSTGNFTLTAASIPAHTHGYLAENNPVGGGGLAAACGAGIANGSATTDNGTGGGQPHAHSISVTGTASGSVGNGAAHSHSIALNLNYIDVIVCTKN